MMMMLTRTHLYPFLLCTSQFVKVTLVIGVYGQLVFVFKRTFVEVLPEPPSAAHSIVHLHSRAHLM